MLPAFLIPFHRTAAKQKKSISLFILLTIALTATAQDSIRIKPVRLSLVDHDKANSFYRPFTFPISRTIDYSNFPLTANEILRRNSQINGYNRVYNSITNRNGNGFVRNLLGMPKLQRSHPAPGF